MLGRSFFVTLILLLGVSACQRACAPSRTQMGPEDVVESYLETALNMENVSQKDHLLEYTSGNLRAAIAGATDDTIKKAYIDKHYVMESYALVSRKDMTPNDTEIKFQLKTK